MKYFFRFMLLSASGRKDVKPSILRGRVCIVPSALVSSAKQSWSSYVVAQPWFYNPGETQSRCSAGHTVAAKWHGAPQLLRRYEGEVCASQFQKMVNIFDTSLRGSVLASWELNDLDVGTWLCLRWLTEDWPPGPAGVAVNNKMTF